MNSNHLKIEKIYSQSVTVYVALIQEPCSQWRLRISVTKLLFPIIIFAFTFFQKWYSTFPYIKLQLWQSNSSQLNDSQNYNSISYFNCFTSVALNLAINSIKTMSSLTHYLLIIWSCFRFLKLQAVLLRT